jgi:hypothetical protein
MQPLIVFEFYTFCVRKKKKNLCLVWFKESLRKITSSTTFEKVNLAQLLNACAQILPPL